VDEKPLKQEMVSKNPSPHLRGPADVMDCGVLVCKFTRITFCVRVDECLKW